MATSPAEIHIDDIAEIDALKDFHQPNFPEIGLSDVAEKSFGAGAIPQPPVPMPEGNAFRKVAAETCENNKKFLTAVEQGFAAFAGGAQLMAASYNAANQEMTMTMEEVTTRDPGKPDISSAFIRPTG